MKVWQQNQTIHKNTITKPDYKNFSTSPTLASPSQILKERLQAKHIWPVYYRYFFFFAIFCTLKSTGSPLMPIYCDKVRDIYFGKSSKEEMEPGYNLTTVYSDLPDKNLLWNRIIDSPRKQSSIY